MPEVMTFAQVLAETSHCKRHLLLGNGFSIALFADRFRYGSLLDAADFSAVPEARTAFERLQTSDFELVIQALRHAVALAPIYGVSAASISKMMAHADAVKELLVRAIAGKHPERPSEITTEQYAACRKFLSEFIGDARRIGSSDLRGKIYTLNYDLLLYWTLLHSNPVDFFGDSAVAESFEHDDGFRAPHDDPDAEYVTWDAEGAADGQNVHFLHGGLHLFDYGAELQKKCWERSGGQPLIEQVRSALSANKFPLYVAEGNTEDKLARIRHSGYLQRSLKSFAGVCKTRRGSDCSIIVYGHSLASNDEHVLKLIERGSIPRIYISIYGDHGAPYNAPIIARAERMAVIRGERAPLRVKYFDAASAAVWGA